MLILFEDSGHLKPPELRALSTNVFYHICCKNCKISIFQHTDIWRTNTVSQDFFGTQHRKPIKDSDIYSHIHVASHF